MGQVCAKHNEFYEERCRWCDSYVAASPLGHLADVVRTVVEHRIRLMEGSIVPAPPPEPKPILIGGILYSPCVTSFPNDGHGSLE